MPVSPDVMDGVPTETGIYYQKPLDEDGNPSSMFWRITEVRFDIDEYDNPTGHNMDYHSLHHNPVIFGVDEVDGETVKMQDYIWSERIETPGEV